MRKLFLSVFFVFVFSFLASVKVNAQSTSVAQIINVCLKTVRCVEKAGNCTTRSSHRVRLSSDDNTKPPASSNTYITECIMYDIPNDGTSAPQYVCTTGDSRLDMDLFCNKRTADGKADAARCEADKRPGGDLASYDHFQQLKKDLDYTLTPGRDTTGNGIFHFNGVSYERKTPASDQNTLIVRTNGSGTIPLLEWESSTPKNKRYPHTYKAWTKISSTQSSTGSVGGQQQATLDFSYKMSECSSVTFDPYGRVFDAVSLEPIPGSFSGGDINVRLLQKVGTTEDFTYDEAQKQNINLANPINPLADGFFAFFVEDGDYKLNVEGSALNSTYEFRDSPATPEQFNNLYKDIYYKNSPPIQQQGQIQHRDIPLYRKDGSGGVYDIKLISQFQDATDNGDIRFHGQVSHPYAKLTIYPICPNQKAPPWKEYTHRNNTGAPDVNGNFDIIIRQSDLCAGGQFNGVFEKVNLKDSTLSKANIQNKILAFLKKLIPNFAVQAQESSTTSVTINPIPLYIEGFAYDATGKLAPNATVEIHISQTGLPIYSTKADANGFFRITSEYLPRYPYTLKVVSANKKEVTFTTAQFLTQNADFVQKEKINVFRAATTSTNPRANITPSYIPKQSIALNITPSAESKVTPATSVTPAPQASNQSALMLVGVVLLLLLGTAGIMLGIYIYKKNSTPPPEMY